MKNSKEIRETLPYLNLPAFIEKLREQRDGLENFNINFTIILLSTTVIESVLYDLLSLTIREKVDSDTIEGRLADDLLSKIDKGTWSTFNKTAEILFNKKLNICVNNELWNKIQNLFRYRNFISHGKPFTMNIYKEGDETKFKIEGDISKVIQFLIQMKLVQAEKPAILNSDISDFFWESTKEFVSAISLKLKNDYNEVVFLMLRDAIKQ
jgi:hypothetical protein